MRFCLAHKCRSLVSSVLSYSERRGPWERGLLISMGDVSASIAILFIYIIDLWELLVEIFFFHQNLINYQLTCKFFCNKPR